MLRAEYHLYSSAQWTTHGVVNLSACVLPSVTHPYLSQSTGCWVRHLVSIVKIPRLLT